MAEMLYSNQRKQNRKIEDDGNKFGEVLILPPAFDPVPPNEKDIE